MASPAEVQDNVAVIVEMCRGPEAVLDLAPLGEADGQQQQQQQQQCSNGVDGGRKPSRGKEGGAAGLTGEEQQVLQKVGAVLQPVKDVDWPVGLTDNRK